MGGKFAKSHPTYINVNSASLSLKHISLRYTIEKKQNQGEHQHKTNAINHRGNKLSGKKSKNPALQAEVTQDSGGIVMAKILIVDDSNLSRRILRTILAPEGHEIIEATDGLLGIETYVIEQPDLVLLDIAMPGIPGDEALEKIREINQAARVIMATADLQDLTKTKVLAAGAMGFINKPFSRAKVLDTVNQVLSTISEVS